MKIAIEEINNQFFIDLGNDTFYYLLGGIYIRHYRKGKLCDGQFVCESERKNKEIILKRIAEFVENFY